MHPALDSYLQEERQRQEREGIQGPFVIPGGNTYNKAHYRERPIGSNALQRAFSDMVCAEGMDKRITIYSLRHTLATELLRQGVDIVTVKEILGHSDIRTTMHYLHTLKVEEQPVEAVRW
jgi:site-specific recombinase XerD